MTSIPGCSSRTGRRTRSASRRHRTCRPCSPSSSASTRSPWTRKRPPARRARSKPFDIMLVLDRTGSMCQIRRIATITAFTTGNARRDEDVPGADGSAATIRSGSRCCRRASVATQCRAAARLPEELHDVLTTQRPGCLHDRPLSSDYASTPGTLNAGSNLVQTIDCVHSTGRTGMPTRSTRADRSSMTDGRPGVQKVIIFLSDGAANYGADVATRARSPYRTTALPSGSRRRPALAKRQQTTDLLDRIRPQRGRTDTSSADRNEPAHRYDLEEPPMTAFQAMRQSQRSPTDTFYNMPNPGS